MSVVPNATITVLHELTGDGASKQSLRIEGYVSTTDRIEPETADILIDTAASYEGLVGESAEILGTLDVSRIIPSVVARAFRNEIASEALAREVFAQAFGIPAKQVEPATAVTDLQTFLNEVAESDLPQDKRSVLQYLCDEAQKAKDELLVSFNRTLEVGAGQNEAYTHSAARRGGEGTYEHFGHGLKVHLESGDIHVQGVEVSRVVVQDGSYKPKRSKAKTLAKDELRRRLPLGKWRQLVLRRGKFQSVIIRGKQFTPDDFSPIE